MAAHDETNNGTVNFKSVTMPAYLVLSLIMPIATAIGLYYGMDNNIALVKKDISQIQTDLNKSVMDSTTYRGILQKDIIATIDLRISELKNEIAASNSKSFNEFNQTLATVRQDIQQMQFTINQIDRSYQTVKLDQQGLQKRVEEIEKQLQNLKLELAKLESTRKQ